MINLHDIRYLRIGTPDLESAIRFARDIVGLQLVAREGKTAYFRSDKVDVRGDTRDYSLAYFEGDPSDHTIGFDLLDAGDLDAVAAALEAAGRPARLGTKDEAEQRRCRGFVASTDPTGNKIEIVARPYHSGVRYFPGRDAGVTGFSHIGLFSTDVARDEAFWTEGVQRARQRLDRRCVVPAHRHDPSLGGAVPGAARRHPAHQPPGRGCGRRDEVLLLAQGQGRDDHLRAGTPSDLDRGDGLFRGAGQAHLRIFLRRQVYLEGRGQDATARASSRARP